jgi:hypothetical protein
MKRTTEEAVETRERIFDCVEIVFSDHGLT